MRPGAIAVFCEPCGTNRLLNWARVRLQHRAQKRTRDERPIVTTDLETLSEIFGNVTVQGYQFLTALGKLVHSRRLCRVLEVIDLLVLGRAPFLQKYCRYVVITLVR